VACQPEIPCKERGCRYLRRGALSLNHGTHPAQNHQKTTCPTEVGRIKIEQVYRKEKWGGGLEVRREKAIIFDLQNFAKLLRKSMVTWPVQGEKSGDDRRRTLHITQPEILSIFVAKGKNSNRLKKAAGKTEVRASAHSGTLEKKILSFVQLLSETI